MTLKNCGPATLEVSHGSPQNWWFLLDGSSFSKEAFSGSIFKLFGGIYRFLLCVNGGEDSSMIFCHHPIIGSATPKNIFPIKLIHSILGHLRSSGSGDCLTGEIWGKIRKTWGGEKHVASKFPEKNKKWGKTMKTHHFNKDFTQQSGFCLRKT